MSILDIKAKFAQRVKMDADEKPNENEETLPENGTMKPRQFLSETDLGVSQFMCDLPGFTGVIKHRFTDFSVHEINTKQKTIVLDSFDPPDEAAPKVSKEDALLSSENADELDKLLDGDSEKSCVEIDVTEHTKEQRTDLHRYLKEKYGGRILANTVDKDEKKFISVSLYAKGDKKDNRWPGHLPNHLHFTLFKRNVDTHKALHIIAQKLRLKADVFAIAGTKDKRAITTQRVSVKNLRAQRLIDLKKGLRDMSLGNYEYKNHPLALGSLWGNNFEIAMRDVTAEDEDIEKSMVALKEHGFINYYGAQRFGVCVESPTHLIGKLLIKEQYKLALELVLKPREDDRPDLRKARAIYAKTSNAREAWAAINSKHSLEAQLLDGLRKNGATAYANAFDSLPRNMRLLYIHSYQSYVWNIVATKRMEKHGRKVLVGDLVKNRTNREEETEDAVEEDEKEEIRPQKLQPNVVTAENIRDFNFYDVLLPLPGTEAVYPDNETRDLYTEVLAQDDLTTESFCNRSKKYNLSGAYRHIARIPKNLSWRIVRYAHADQDLILSDVDHLEGKTLPENTGNLKALIIKMDLSKSSYATMALREILRCDTASGHHSNLTLKRRNQDAADAAAAKKLKNGSEEGADE